MAQTNRRSANRERLLDQGVMMLMEQGYHGTGIKEVLDAVRIPKGSFYNYFGSKEQFGAEVIAHYIEPFIQQVNEHLSAPDLDALPALRRYFDVLVSELEAKSFQGGCLLGNLMGEIGDTSEVCRQALARSVRRYRDCLKKGLSRAQQEGTVRTDLSAEEMADFLVDAWQGALLRMKIEQSVRPLESCCDHLLGAYFKV